MKLLAYFRKRVFSLRRSNWAFAIAASIAMIGAGAFAFIYAPVIGLLLFIAAQGVGYFAPRKRFIVSNLAISLIALVILSAMRPGAIAFAEFMAAAIIMGLFATIVHALRSTEEQMDDARWRADIATEAAEIGIFKWDFDSDLVTSNAAFRAVWELPEAGKLYAPDAFAKIHDDDIEDVRSRIDNAVLGKSAYHAEFRIFTSDARDRFKWIEARGDIVRDRRTGKRSLAGVNIDITERKEGASYVGRLFSGIDAAIGLTDERGRVLQLNHVAAEIFGEDEATARGEFLWELPTLKEHAGDLQRLFNASKDDKAPIEFIVERDGKPKTFLLSLSHSRRADGSVNFIPYAVEITRRKEAEMKNELLVAELNHRIKNLFSVVNALITLSARHASSVEDFASSTVSRLAALHEAHNLGAADLRTRGAMLFNIFAKTLAPWQTDDQRIFISGQDRFVDAGQATSWALIAHELTMNANKYGALVNGGKVHVEFEGGPTDWRLIWREENPEMRNQGPENKGFGHTVIKRLSAAYLDADVDFNFEPRGLQVTIAKRPPADA